jgi:xylan 1,4-beta-xylosidase
MLRSGVREKPDVAAFASLEQKRLSVMLWHYHDDDVPGASAAVELALNSLPVPQGEVKVRQFRIDEEHSNAFTAWKRMGSPQSPTAEQHAQLERTGKLASLADQSVAVKEGHATLRLELPRQAVALLVFEW